ncbi:hypothetical protein B6U45_07735 [Ligilactobacillus salivarius]|nr:hypothetical protein B6U45_07735 [Ligilactobacillus salivarius]
MVVYKKNKNRRKNKLLIRNNFYADNYYDSSVGNDARDTIKEYIRGYSISL